MECNFLGMQILLAIQVSERPFDTRLGEQVSAYVQLSV